MSVLQKSSAVSLCSLSCGNLYVIAVTVKMYGNYGYLSMIDWPLLPVCVSHLLEE